MARRTAGNNLHLDVQDASAALGSDISHRSKGGSVATASEGCMLDEGILVDQFLETFGGSEVVFNAVRLTSPGRTRSVFRPVSKMNGDSAVRKENTHERRRIQKSRDVPQKGVSTELICLCRRALKRTITGGATSRRLAQCRSRRSAASYNSRCCGEGNINALGAMLSVDGRV